MPIFGRGDYNLINTDDDPIPAEEPVCLIRGQDTIGWMVVRFYALLADILLNNPRLAGRMRAHSDRMREWPTKKNPDVPPER